MYSSACLHPHPPTDIRHRQEAWPKLLYSKLHYWVRCSYNLHWIRICGHLCLHAKIKWWICCRVSLLLARLAVLQLGKKNSHQTHHVRWLSFDVKGKILYVSFNPQLYLRFNSLWIKITLMWDEWNVTSCWCWMNESRSAADELVCVNKMHNAVCGN